MRRPILVLSSSVVLVVVSGACGGCSDDPPAVPRDAGIDGKDAADTSALDSTPCTAPARPSFVPPSWTAFDGLAPCSGLYVPTTKADLPSAFVWEACGPEAVPQVSGCRRLKSAFDGEPTNGDANTSSSGEVTILQVSGFKDEGGLFKVGAPDGTIGSAIAWTKAKAGAWYQPTIPLTQSIAAPFWLLEVRWLPTVAPIGYVAGRLDDPKGPSNLVAQQFDTTVRYALGVGQPGILHWNLGNIELLDFDTGKHLTDITSPAANGGLAQGALRFFGNTLTWVGNSNRTLIARRWDVGDTNPTDFIDYRPDDDHAAGNLATDGKVLVWLEGHGPEQINGAFWTTGDYWMAPLVKDPKALAPKRIRSELPNAVGQLPLVVGCGMVTTANSKGTRIVRLADGYSTFLPGDPKTSWNWLHPLAITCNEIFIRTGYKADTGLVRIPIASLPFADPPD